MVDKRDEMDRISYDETWCVHQSLKDWTNDLLIKPRRGSKEAYVKCFKRIGEEEREKRQKCSSLPSLITDQSAWNPVLKLVDKARIGRVMKEAYLIPSMYVHIPERALVSPL